MLADDSDLLHHNGTKMVSPGETMLNMTLKNIPVTLHQWLKARAESNHRSLNREILALLESQRQAPSVDVAAEQKALEEFVGRLPRVDHARVRRYRNAGRA
jgi:plasmid stability protein